VSLLQNEHRLLLFVAARVIPGCTLSCSSSAAIVTFVEIHFLPPVCGRPRPAQGPPKHKYLQSSESQEWSKHNTEGLMLTTWWQCWQWPRPWVAQKLGCGRAVFWGESISSKHLTNSEEISHTSSIKTIRCGARSGREVCRKKAIPIWTKGKKCKRGK